MSLDFWKAGLIYLRTMRIEVVIDSDDVSVTVASNGNGAPLAGAIVSCDVCSDVAEAVTDEAGVAVLGAPSGDGVIEARLEGWNAATMLVPPH